MPSISDILQGGDNPQSQLFQAQNQLGQLQDLATQAGIPEEMQQPRESALMAFLNVLGKPRQFVEGILDSALVRGDIGNIGLWGAAKRGMDERITGEDILRRGNLESPIARGVLGFAGDVLLDPLSWLAIGPAGKLASAGGFKLTEEGTKVLNLAKTKAFANLPGDIEKAATMQGLALNDAKAMGNLRAMKVAENELKVNEAFTAAHDYWSQAIDLQRAKDPTIKELLAKQMADTATKFNGYIDEKDVGQLFAKPRVAFEQNIPFLGKLFDEGKGAKGFLSPKNVKLGEYEFSDAQIGAYRNIKDTANKMLSNFKEQVKAIATKGEDLPVVGGAVGKVNDVAKFVENAVSGLGKAFQGTFLFKTLLGEKGHNAYVDYLSKQAGLKQYAIQDALTKFPEKEIPEMQGTLESISKVFDAANANFMDNVFDKIKDPADQKALLQYINDVRKNLPADGSFLKKYSDVDFGLGDYLNKEIANAQLDENGQKILGRVMGHMDQIRQREQSFGIDTPFLAYYIPHYYGNFNEIQAARKAEGFAVDGARGTATTFAPSFIKERSFKTLDEAKEARGLIGTKNVADLYAYRLYQSEMAIAKKQYFQRVILENGMAGEKYAQLLAEAQFVDSSVKSIADKARGAKYLLERERMPIPNLTERGAVDTVEQLGKVYQGDFNETVRQQILATGQLPKDMANPQEFLRELAGHVELDGKSYILPTAVADAFKQTLGARDWLKANAGSEFKSFLNSMDATMGFYKRAVTYPWPAYYFQNLVGDRLNGFFADGMESQDPGHFYKVYQYLKGEKALTTPGGVVWDKHSLLAAANQHGIKMSHLDYLDFIDNTANLNIDKYMKGLKGFKGNLAEGDALAALSAAHSKFQDGFENFFRISQFVHHMERGSTLEDAARLSQNALINYRDLSPNEASIARRFYMFYGWTSKATQKQISNLFFAPGNLTKQISASRAASEAFSEPDAAPTPDDYERKVLQSMINSENIVVPLGKDKEGNPLVGRVANLPIATPLQQFSIQLPRNWSVGEMVDAGLDSVQRTVQKQFASANPVINAAAQLVTGKNLYFNKDLNTPFLRKIPTLAAMAQKLGVYDYTKIPVDALDDAAQSFLKAVPDGKGYAVADPGRFWLLTNLLPGMSRILATGGSFADIRVPTDKALVRYLTGIRVDTTSDPEKSYLYDQISNLKKSIEDDSLRQIIKNKQQE